MLLLYKQLTVLQVENPAFKRFLHLLSPAYAPPNRRALAGHLLDDVYAHTKAQMDRIIKEAAGQLTLVTDGWTNQRVESLTNYVVSTRKHSIFVDSEVVTERHTGEVIESGITRILEELGGQKAVVAVVTDSAANMRKAWPELQSRYPGLLTLGCASHQVNLLVGDILKVSTLATTLNNALHVIRYFKSSPARTNELNKAASRLEERRVALKLPAATRWQGKMEATRSLIQNKPYVQAVLANQTACLGTSVTTKNMALWAEMKALVEDYWFWAQLDTLQQFLKPYLKVTLWLESTKPTGSRLYPYFHDLLDEVPPSGLNREEIHTLILNRWRKVAHPLFLVAFICDPAARNAWPNLVISPDTLATITAWLGSYYSNEPGVAASVRAELMDCLHRRGIYRCQIVWDSFQMYEDPADWWLEQQCSPHLQALAIYALSISPTTGAAERNWSSHSYIHSKARNRLSNERVKKLVYLFQNLRVRDQVLTSTPSYFDEEEVELGWDSSTDKNELVDDETDELMAVVGPA